MRVYVCMVVCVCVWGTGGCPAGSGGKGAVWCQCRRCVGGSVCIWGRPSRCAPENWILRFGEFKSTPTCRHTHTHTGRPILAIQCTLRFRLTGSADRQVFIFILKLHSLFFCLSPLFLLSARNTHTGTSVITHSFYEQLPWLWPVSKWFEKGENDSSWIPSCCLYERNRDCEAESLHK